MIYRHFTLPHIVLLFFCFQFLYLLFSFQDFVNNFYFLCLSTYCISSINFSFQTLCLPFLSFFFSSFFFSSVLHNFHSVLLSSRACIIALNFFLLLSVLSFFCKTYYLSQTEELKRFLTTLHHYRRRLAWLSIAPVHFIVPSI